MSQQIIIQAAPSGVAYRIRVMNDLSSFIFEPFELFKDEMTSSQLTADGRTIGQVSRDRIHEKLEEFINKCLGSNHE